MNVELLRSLRHNTTVNLLDGAFFGFAAGFASFVTVLPLFISTMTDSPILIGLIPSIHAAGWQLPQILTVTWISRRDRITPLVVLLTSIERIPYLGLAFLALLLPRIGPQVGLVIAFTLLIVQGLGAGLTANPWQSMIAKIIPGNRRGTFLGLQAGLSYLVASLGAVLAGQILGRTQGSSGFAILFFIASLMLAISWIFLALTREPAEVIPLPSETVPPSIDLRTVMHRILRRTDQRDRNFAWFLIARLLSQLALVGYAFFSVYAVKHHGVGGIEIGYMTAVFMGANVLANIGMGWIGDHYGHRKVMILGLVAMSLSALLAFLASSPAWFYLVFVLAAIGNVAIWTIAMSMTLEFGSQDERPAYIGLANSLVAPANILAPFLGGWLAASFGYPAAFLLSVVGGLLAALVFHFLVKDQPPFHLLFPTLTDRDETPSAPSVT